MQSYCNKREEQREKAENERLNVLLPAYPLRVLRQIFFAIRKKNYPKPVIVFTICAEKVYYKVSNTCYKLCNAC